MNWAAVPFVMQAIDWLEEAHAGGSDVGVLIKIAEHLGVALFGRVIVRPRRTSPGAHLPRPAGVAGEQPHLTGATVRRDGGIRSHSSMFWDQPAAPDEFFVDQDVPTGMRLPSLSLSGAAQTIPPLGNSRQHGCNGGPFMPYPVSRSILGLVLLLGLLIVTTAELHAAGTCGNGVREASEECDPGGTLRKNGDSGLAVCTTGNDCFFELSCCKFNCQYRRARAPCADGNDCTTTDHCDQVGQCIGSFKPNGDPCNDDVFCSGADTCQTGECAGHAGDPCAGNTNCVATCDEGADQCTSTPFVPCTDDGNTCTDDVCDGSAVCTHPALPGGTICRAAATVCDVAEACSGGGAPCPADSVVPNGTNCGDACTTGGTCQSGQCTGGSPLVCDDNDVCNGLETCDSLTGCVPGQPLDCVDSNSCTADLCAPVGGCSNPVLPDGAPCNDGRALLALRFLRRRRLRRRRRPDGGAQKALFGT